MSKPTNSELEILRLLWQKGPQTVREINEAMNEQRRADAKAIGYTTTLKLMQIMHEKRLLSRRREGKTHIYRAAVTEKATQQQLLDRLLDTAFHGSAMKLVMQALGSRESSPEELDEIRRFLDQLSENENASDESKK
jgi:BlaI family penicillinase repressor